MRQGILRAAGLPFYGQLDWIGFWDADLSTPLEELPRFLGFPAFCGVGADAVIGSRVMRLGSRVHRNALRHLFGRAFVTVASLLLKVQAYDSQCGAKLFRPAAAARAFAEPFVTRWIFDLEVLLRLGDGMVLDIPSWHGPMSAAASSGCCPTSGGRRATCCACGLATGDDRVPGERATRCDEGASILNSLTL